MSSVNKVILIGNLGGDPEVRYTQSGQAWAKFSMATSENWTDKQGQKQEKTEWHNIVLWGKLAELAGQYLSKGRKVYIEGKLQTRQWDDRDGNKRYTTEIQGREMTFLGGRQGENTSGGYAANAGGGGGGYGASAGGENASGSGSGGGGGGGSFNAGSQSGGGQNYDYNAPTMTDDDVPF